MNRKNKIVRVKNIVGTNDNPERQYYHTYVTTFDKAMQDTAIKGYGGSREIYPYKWYELQWIITHPAYYLLRSLSVAFKNDLNNNKIARIVARSSIFVINSACAWFIVEVLKSFLEIPSAFK